MLHQTYTLSLLNLLAAQTVALELGEAAQTAAFSAYDQEKLWQLCQRETLYCDSPAERLVVTAWRGGYLKGNYCYLTGLLYQAEEAEPVATLEIRFGPYLSGPEIYLQSLRSSFTWANDFAAMRVATPERWTPPVMGTPPWNEEPEETFTPGLPQALLPFEAMPSEST